MKAEHYRCLESLQEYLLIAQDRPYIERYVRQGDGSWKLWEARGLDASIRIETIAIDLPMAEVYDRVDFEKAPTR